MKKLLLYSLLMVSVSAINTYGMEDKSGKQEIQEAPKKHLTGVKNAVNRLGEKLERKGLSSLAEACYKTTEKALNSPTGALHLAEQKKGSDKIAELKKAATLANGKPSTRWSAAFQLQTTFANQVTELDAKAQELTEQLKKINKEVYTLSAIDSDDARRKKAACEHMKTIVKEQLKSTEEKANALRIEAALYNEIMSKEAEKMQAEQK